MMNIYYRFRKRPFILCFWTMLSCVYSISIFPTVVFGKEGESIIYMQNLQVTGQVKDIKGEPLPGVTVTIKGTKRAVTTNTDGKYTITNVGKSSVLLFSFLGFETQERTIGDNKIINVALKEVATGLNEVVVIGYGSVKRGDLTGAVGQVKIEDMEKAPVISFEQALAGRIAGVDVS